MGAGNKFVIRQDLIHIKTYCCDSSHQYRIFLGVEDITVKLNGGLY